MKYPIRLFALAAAVALSLACAPGALAAPIVDPTSPAENWAQGISGLDYEPGVVVVGFTASVELEQAQTLIRERGLVPDSHVGNWGESGIKKLKAHFPKGMSGYEASVLMKTSNLVKDVYPAVWAFANDPYSGWRRLSGDTALGTMKDIVRSGDGFGSDRRATVVLASASGYWDALSASGLAGWVDAPVILTDPETLSPEAMGLIQQLDPDRLIVCGGEESVSEAVAREAAQLSSASLFRVAGETASDTAVEVFRASTTWTDTAFIATSATFQDALSIAPCSYCKHRPLFLAEPDGTLSAATQQALEDGGFSHVYLVGGEHYLPASLADQLGPLYAGRLAGDTAVDTSLAVARYELSIGMMGRVHVGVATPQTWYDALCGAALCGRHSSILVLATDEQRQALDALNLKSMYWGHVFGGPLSVSEETLDYLGREGDGPIPPDNTEVVPDEVSR